MIAPHSRNGHGPHESHAAPEASDSSRPTSGNDAALFGIFAAIAQQLGRTDLHAEFTRRAGAAPADPAPAPAPSPAAHTPHPDAARHTRTGCRLIGEGKFPEAERAFREAIRLDPRGPGAHGDLGVCFAHQRRLPEAEAAFRVAIGLDPVNVTMYVNLATCLFQQRRHTESEQWARQAVQLKPQHADAHRVLGTALDAQNKLEPAEEAFREAARLDPQHADGRLKLGRILARRGIHKEAEAEFREVTRLKPDLVDAWAALTQLLSDTDRHADAIDSARAAVHLTPQSADRHNSLGVALAGAEKYAEAEAAYREAIRLNPKLASAHSNLGNVLRNLGRLEEAEGTLREAIRRAPEFADAHNNLGIVLVQSGRETEAQTHYDHALRIRPDYPEARMNRGLSRLADGDFARGWPDYEARFQVNRKHKAPPGPRWDGSPFPGKILLITSEQGLGDSLQFIRYAALAKARGGTVLFDCPDPLASIVATCPGIDRVVNRGKPGVTYDTHIPLLSLPAIFGVPPEAETSPIPYLTPDPARVQYWRNELAHVPGLRVGISWQGSTIHKGDKLRSVHLNRFAPLAAVPGVTLCSLQKGTGTEQLTGPGTAGLGVLDLGARTGKDMADVAALMMNLDLVVSVDTALVHLAGALGRPAWVALPFAADWRWLRKGETTRWYPSVRLFRPTARGDWDGVFGRLAAALAAEAKGRGERRGDHEPVAVHVVRA